MALAIPTGVVVALDATMSDNPKQQEPPATSQIVPDAPLTGPADPETEPLLPDTSGDADRPNKERGDDREKPAKNEPAEKKGKPDKESPDDALVSVPAVDPLIGAVDLETPTPIAEACAALAGGKCPVDDLAGALEQVLDACTDDDSETECPTDDVTDLVPSPDTEVLRPILDPAEQPVPTPELPVPVIELPVPTPPATPEPVPPAGTGQDSAPGQTVELDSNGELARALLQELGLSEKRASKLALGLQIRAAQQQD